MLTVLRKFDPTLWSSELRCATGRSAIYYLLKQLSNPSVLLPSYLPEGLELPVRSRASRVCYYKLREDLTPNFEDLKLKMKENDLVVVINYFGANFPEMQRIKSLTVEKGAILFADNANALYDTAVDADVALWSVNKFLPVPDGAILRSRIDSVYLDVDERMLLPSNRAALRAYETHLVETKFGCRDIVKAYERYYAAIREDFTLRRQSWRSRQAEQELGGLDLENRACNSQALHHRLADRSPHFFEPRGAGLFAYPIICRNRDAVKNRLKDVGVEAATFSEHWTVGQFEIEKVFYDTHLLLPVDGSVNHKDIERMAAAVRDKREAA